MPRTTTVKKRTVSDTISPRYEHQNETLRKLKKTPILFDMSDPGTGKTRVQIDAFSERRRKGGGKALILATKSLLDAAWKHDFHTFAPDMVVSLAFASNRQEALRRKDADVVVTNHDAAKDLAKLPDAFWNDFDTLIIDESTAFKHHTSQRSKAVAKLAKHFKYRVCMSGTPTSNGILDIWHQVYILDEGKKLGKSFFGFRAAACEPIQVGPSSKMVKWVDRDGVDLVIAEILKDIAIRHQFEDCVDIPENHKYAVPFSLPKKLQSFYNDMQDYHFVQLKKTGITAVNGAVVYGKLLQIASGAVYNDDASYSVLDNSRYELVMDLVEERPHSIVFFSWEHQREELVREAEKRGVSYAVFDGSTHERRRAIIVEEYQEGKYQVLFAHPQSAGHGLTLTRGSATIWSSPTYNLEHFLQGLKRIHRIGQTQKTETIVVVAEGTIDEKVWDVLQAKNAKQSDFMKLLKQGV